MGELSQTLVTVGQALGATFFTSLSDRYGRKPVFIFTHLCLFIVSLILAFVPTYPTFAFLRLLIGTLQQIIPSECRGTIGTIGALVWTTCVVLLTPVGYFLRNYSWRYVQLVVALTSIHSLWLIANNKREEAIKVVRKAAKWNKLIPFLTVLRRAQQSAQGIRGVNINEADAYTPVPRVPTCQQPESTSPSLIDSDNENGVARTMSSVFTFIGKFGITASFSTIFLYTPELYPTNLRNSGIGIASAASRVGGMAAPYVSLLKQKDGSFLKHLMS
ncbi:LOW QUALITY PROTEIN: hypothetical protein KUTeg_017518 [Tegillarca granosa]|uniref:Major facilitator superfamily (MFS) profile domain-containing protein n=1 Tax=Tegillarca granosa TaxID=220873 RepID=A0ABQ9EFH9_TEGGR|nr:LOW QUALITY PROTEIN: hypothetical protein KUTeg_017518 [Tegillarca granosa]